MTDLIPSPPHRVALVRVIGTAALGLWTAAACRAFTPDLPQVGLDASWVAVMGEAADRGLRWGADLAFTYGPAASLVTHYGNDAYLPLTLPLLLATCLLFAGCALRLAGGTAGRTLLIVVALGLVVADVGGTPDAIFLVLPLLPALLSLSRDPPPGRAAAALAAAMAMALGAVGLAKMSYPLAALPLLLGADGVRLRYRRLPLLAPSFVAGFLVAELAYGQSLADLPAFLRQQSEVVAGYSEAMALDGNRWELLAFLVAAGALVAMSLRWELRLRAAGTRAAVPLCLAWTLFMLFKAGFVRQDLHTVIAWNGLALAAAVLAAARLGRWRGGAAPGLLAVALGCAVTVDAGVAALTVEPPARGFATALAFERDRLILDPWTQASAAAALLADPAGAIADLRDARAGAWRAAAEAEPLPRLAGSVDVIPSRQNAVVAAGLDYRPRPSFQEYSTYTEGLAATNRAFVEGPRGPDWILFGPEAGSASLTLDGRYSNFAEGALWPALLRLYRPERTIGGLLALHRRATPADIALGAPRRSIVGLDEILPVDDSSAVFATVDVRPTLAGRLAGLLFRPAPLWMSVTFADGHAHSYQFISGIGRAGFVLSPLVPDAAGFAALAEGAAPPPERRVTAIAIHAPRRAGWLFEPGIAVVLQTLNVAVAPPRTPVP